MFQETENSWLCREIQRQDDLAKAGARAKADRLARLNRCMTQITAILEAANRTSFSWRSDGPPNRRKGPPDDFEIREEDGNWLFKMNKDTRVLVFTDSWGMEDILGWFSTRILDEMERLLLPADGVSQELLGNAEEMNALLPSPEVTDQDLLHAFERLCQRYGVKSRGFDPKAITAPIHGYAYDGTTQWAMAYRPGAGTTQWAMAYRPGAGWMIVNGAGGCGATFSRASGYVRTRWDFLMLIEGLIQASWKTPVEQVDGP